MLIRRLGKKEVANRGVRGAGELLELLQGRRRLAQLPLAELGEPPD
jgi:hypothetical protein